MSNEVGFLINGLNKQSAEKAILKASQANPIELEKIIIIQKVC